MHLTPGDRRVVPQLRLHHGLVVGHLEEVAGVGLQNDRGGLGEVLMPVQHDVSVEKQAAAGGRATSAHAVHVL